MPFAGRAYRRVHPLFDDSRALNAFVKIPGLVAEMAVVILLLTWGRQRELMSASLQKQAAAQDYQFEMLTGMETLKAMGVEQTAVER